MAATSASVETVEPVRVLHVAHDMAVGGAQQVIARLVLDMDPARVRGEVVCLDGAVGSLGERLAAQGVPVACLTRRPGFDRPLIVELRRLIRSRRIDVVHCHQYTPWTYGVLASIGTGARVLFTEHGRFHPDRYSWKRRLLNRPLARLTDEIVAISVATRDALVRYEWLPGSRIRVVYNGVRPPERREGAPSVRERLHIPDECAVLGTIARLDPIKDQAGMIEALAALRARDRDVCLLLAGDGPERAALEALAYARGLAEHVYFTGFVDDIADHLDAIDIFLLTSWSEGTSMTLLEAMSFAKAIVATRVGGTVELIEPDRSGVLIDAGDSEGLADAVASLLDEPDRRALLGSSARAVFERRFEATVMRDAYVALYGA